MISCVVDTLPNVSLHGHEQLFRSTQPREFELMAQQVLKVVGSKEANCIIPIYRA